jgi:hypothetical protein
MYLQIFTWNTFFFVCWKWQHCDMELEAMFNSFQALKIYISEHV